MTDLNSIIFPKGSNSTMTNDMPLVSFVRGPIVSSENAINNEATPSIAFAYLGAYILNLGYPFCIVDAVAEGLNQFWKDSDFSGFHCQGLTYNEIIKRIPSNSKVIAFSAMFSGEWPFIRKMVNMVREKYPNALFIAGGEHITALTEYALRDCPALDVAVRGEGEHVLYEVLEAHRTGENFENIGGVSFISETGEYIKVDTVTRIREVNKVPWPIWPEGYLEMFWDSGKSYGVLTEKDMPIMASRGCPYQCTFCSSPQMWTTRYTLRDINDLINEIKSYKKRYDITALQFYDLTAIIKKDWTIEFSNRLISEGLNLRWSLPSGTRSEALDAETLAMLKKTNCNYLVYAPESGSEETLKKIKKRIKLQKITESILEAKKQGLVIRTNLIIGFPHETRKNVFATLKYGFYLAWKGVDEVSINIFSPYPGTEIFNELLQKKKIKLEDDYFFGITSLNSDYTVTNPLTYDSTMSSRELAGYRISFLLMNYILGYLRYPSRILRTLKNVFTTSGDAATVFEHRLKDLFKQKHFN